MAWRAGSRRERGSRPRGAARPNGVGPCGSCRPSIRRKGASQDHAEFGPIIQEEVRRLPEKYRAVVALCYWQGLTQEQAAAQLGCPLGTVRSRLARARGKLHTRLTRRGLAPLAGLVAAALESRSAEAARLALVPNTLVNSTVKAECSSRGGTCDDRRGFHVRRRSDPKCPQEHVHDETQDGRRSPSCSSVSELTVRVWRRPSRARQSRRRCPTAASRPTAEKSKSKAQPALVTLESYVVEPPDMLIVEVLELFPAGRFQASVWSGPMARFRLVSMESLRRGPDNSRSQGEDRPSPAKIPERRGTRPRRY